MAVGIVLAFVGCQALYHHLTNGPVPWEIIRAGVASTEPGVDGLLDLGGGVVGALVAFPTGRLIGTWGATLVLAALTVTGILIAAHTSFREFVFAIGDLWKGLAAWVRSLHTSRPATPVERRPHRPEIFTGSSVAFCTLALFMLTGRSTLRKFLQQQYCPHFS